MRIFVYKVVHDTGFAPNPFHGWCTLACCKPRIRSSASPGDWVLGLTPKVLGARLTYFMRVEEVLPFDRYFRDPRFEAKKPRDVSGEPPLRRCGDNCYEPVGGGEYRQLPCAHSLEQGEDLVLKALDLGGRFVLASRHFGYFGAEAVPLDESLAFMIPGRGHRSNFTSAQAAEILAFLERQKLGLRGRPRQWPESDTSWRPRTRCV